MKPETLSIIIAAVGLISGVGNAFLSMRSRTAILQMRLALMKSEKRVLDEVERKYVRKRSFDLLRSAEATS